MSEGAATAIAIVDDEPDIRRALRQMLELEGLAPVEFADAESALAQIDADFQGIVIADLRMPGLDGNGFFSRLHRFDPELPVIMMSGHGDIATAVDLVRRGAYDFLSKPFDGDALIVSVRRALEKRALVLENRRLRDLRTGSTDNAILGEAPAIETLRQTLTQLASADIDVLVTGESGVGKSLIASELHRRSPRGRKPIVTVDCATLSGLPAESQLFGHVSGAYPGAQFPRTGQLALANGTTLLLDNVDALPRALQARVLQALEQNLVSPVGGTQAQTSHFRTVSTTRADLTALIEKADFNRSLYFRLGAFRLDVPPLRDRRGDVMVLFRAFLAEASREFAREIPSLSPPIWRRLQDHDWPGNIRELRSFAANVALGLGNSDAVVQTVPVDAGQPGLKQAIAGFEADMIRATLDRHGGDIAATIAALQLPRKTLYDKLARYAISPGAYRSGRAPRR